MVEHSLLIRWQIAMCHQTPLSAFIPGAFFISLLPNEGFLCQKTCGNIFPVFLQTFPNREYLSISTLFLCHVASNAVLSGFPACFVFPSFCFQFVMIFALMEHLPIICDFLLWQAIFLQWGFHSVVISNSVCYSQRLLTSSHGPSTPKWSAWAPDTANKTSIEEFRALSSSWSLIRLS